MKITHVVYVILIFGITLSFVVPHLLSGSSKSTQTYKAEKHNELAKANEEKTQSVDLAMALPEAPEMQPVNVAESVMSPAIFDGLTMEQLTAKLNRSLKSNLTGTGNLFAKYAAENNVDPYLAVAITLLETGCNFQCSAQVRECNNVGGMKGAGNCQGTSYASFPTLEQGIESFIVNIKKNYYDYGLNTPELMNKKYAASKTWAVKVKRYMSQLKAA